MRVPGHGLRREGLYRYDEHGCRIGVTWRDGNIGSGKCECGALSEPNISTNAVQRWHRQHKIRAMREEQGGSA